MKLSRFFYLFVTLLAVTIAVSCSDDDEPTDVCDTHNATYNGDVRAIINSSCAYSGCHDGTGANTFIPAGANDYTSYSGLKASLDSGSFNQRTIVDKNMPPAAFVPAGSPTELTAEQLEILTCWRDAGYPES